jgi:hypothetical protein
LIDRRFRGIQCHGLLKRASQSRFEDHMGAIRKHPIKLTAEKLRKHLRYDPDSGLFIRIKTSGPGRAGDVAGTVHKRGYLVISVCGEDHYAQRLAWLYMTGEWPEATVDHVDRNRLNNRWGNLRPATDEEQSFNKSAWRSKTSTRLVGAFRATGKDSDSAKPWRACIRFKGKLYHIGVYATDIEAHAAYMEAKAEMHGMGLERAIN